jgi:hypothetical protein
MSNLDFDAERLEAELAEVCGQLNAAHARLGGCRVPGCTGGRVQIHHIVHWKDGGPTASHNLAALCPHHHRLHHRGLLAITGNADSPDGLLFTDARGRVLAGAPPPLPPPPGSRIEVTGTWTHPTGERLESRWVHFNSQGLTAEPLAG